MTAAEGPQRARFPWWPAVALVLAALGALGLLIADEAVGSPPSPPEEVVELPQVDRGVRYCPVTAAEDETATLVLATGTQAAEATVVRYGAAGPQSDELRALDPGERVEVALDDDAQRPVSVEWRGGPLAVSWHVEGERDAGGPCLTTPAQDWHLAGIDTALGAEARLHLFNPFSVDAVVRVRFGTPEGRVDLARTDNVVVPAGGTEVLDLVDVQPEETELGVTVETLAGRVVASAEVDRARIDEDDEGPEGRTVVPAVDEPATTWHLPLVNEDGDSWRSHVAVYNPTDRETAVTIHTSDPLEDAARAEYSVPPGGTRRIDVSDYAETSAFAALVETVTDVPVVVVGTETFLDSDRSGHTVQQATAQVSPTWVVPGGVGERAEHVAVHNPGGDPVEVDIIAGGEPVDEWEGLTFEANERRTLSLADVGDPAWPIVIEADGDVSVGLVSSLEDGDDLGRLLGLAFGPAAGDLPAEPVVVRRDPALATEPVRPPDLDDAADDFDDVDLPGLDEPAGPADEEADEPAAEDEGEPAEDAEDGDGA